MSRHRTSVDVVITGGGTAGHVQPALAVARALVAAGHRAETVRFIGSRRGMEADLVPAAGFAVALLPGRGIVRRLTVANLVSAAGLAVALAEALLLLARWRPGAVLSVGGYAGASASLAAAALRIPLVVLNIDAVPGAANRLAGRFATASAVALPGTPLPHAVVTGVPVGAEVLAADRGPDGRARARAALGVPVEARLVAVVGGSLGARRLNDAAVALATAAGAPPEVFVYHVTGRRDHERVAAAADAAGLGERYRAVAYEAQMPSLLAACDLLVSRAGASTVAEVTAIGVASILVPLPNAPGDHQRRNAEVLAAAGAAVLLDDGACTGGELTRLLGELLATQSQLEAMAAAAAGLGRRDAAERIAALVDEVGRPRAGRR